MRLHLIAGKAKNSKIKLVPTVVKHKKRPKKDFTGAAESAPMSQEDWDAGKGCPEHANKRSPDCHDCAMLQPEPTEHEAGRNWGDGEHFDDLVDWEGGKDDPNTIHPLLKAIDSGATVTSLTTGDSWEDDHLPCLDITVVLSDGNTYEYSDWCLAKSGVKMYYQAEGGSEKALAQVVEHLKETIATAKQSGCM